MNKTHDRVIGTVPKTKCVACHAERFDDGTACKACGSYPPKVIASAAAFDKKPKDGCRPMPWEAA